ncbi:putative esterase [Cyphellophora attinorum]|uniref:Putative esterase n=1 Tax=Cyphellophora attinorum TaxID=1664694 RepID=A0A0N1HCE8_9EURO|nr:putative esterase [Phialophora attinorum]KPI41462.1 putative esterase [Phialophora attinorum]
MASIKDLVQDTLHKIAQRFREAESSTQLCTTVVLIITIYILTTKMSRILSHAKTGLYHATETLSIPLQSGSSTTLSSLVQSVLSPCKLNPLLFNGDAQTAATQFLSHNILVHYKRHIFEQEDPAYAGQFAVDFVVRPPPSSAKPNEPPPEDLPPRTTFFTAPEWSTFSTGSTDTTPMLVVLHGLSGGSHELYLRAFLEPLVSPLTSSAKPLNAPDPAWEACVLTSRGCAHTTLSTPILYTPAPPGISGKLSSGGNILVNYLGEEGEKCELAAAVVVSSVWNLEVSALALARSWWGTNIYLRALGSSMKRLFARHEHMIKQVPGIDVEKVRTLRYLNEFDRYVQCATWGYPSEAAYYRDASSVDAMLGVRIPLLAIHALDDPVVCDEVLPYEEIKLRLICIPPEDGEGGEARSAFADGAGMAEG